MTDRTDKIDKIDKTEEGPAGTAQQTRDQAPAQDQIRAREDQTPAQDKDQDPLQSGIAALRDAVKRRMGRLKAQDRTLAELGAAARAGDLPRLSKALTDLDAGLLDGVGEPGAAAALQRKVREALQLLGTTQRRELARGLRAACAEAGVVFARLTENPPEFRVSPFTVKVDPRTMGATLLYARQELEQVAARPTAIIEAARKAHKQLTTRQNPPEQLFALLQQAYRAALGIRGGAPGERVELAELLPQLALARQTRRFAEDPSPQRFRPYTPGSLLLRSGAPAGRAAAGAGRHPAGPGHRHGGFGAAQGASILPGEP